MVPSVLLDGLVEVGWHRDATLVDAELSRVGRCQRNDSCNRGATASDDDFLTCGDSAEKSRQMVLRLMDGDVLHVAIVTNSDGRINTPVKRIRARSPHESDGPSVDGDDP